LIIQQQDFKVQISRGVSSSLFLNLKLKGETTMNAMKKCFVLAVLVAILLAAMLPAAAQAASVVEGPAKPGDVFTLRWQATGVLNPCADDGHFMPVETFRRGESVKIAPAHPDLGVFRSCFAYRVVSQKTGNISWIRGWLLKPAAR
jgi:hypothetical protein